jgi:hypothetical protein
MPKAISALAKLVHPLTVVVQLFTADDGYHIGTNPDGSPRAWRRYRRGLNG